MSDELHTAPIGTALWVYDSIEHRHCLAIKVRPGDADTMIRDVPSGQTRCRVFRVGDVPLVFLLFRFEGYNTTFINVLNYCGPTDSAGGQRSVLESLAVGTKLVFVIYENGEFVGEFESRTATTFWSEIIEGLQAYGIWTQDQWDEAFRAFLSRRIPVEALWDATPKVIGISSYEDLDRYEALLRREGLDNLVDALRDAQRRRQFQALWKSLVADDELT